MNVNTLKDISNKTVDMIIENSEIIKAINSCNVDINNRLAQHKEIITKNSEEIDKLHIKIDFTNKRIDDFKQEVNNRFDETNKRIDDTNKRIDDFKREVNNRFDETNKRIDDTNKRIDEVNNRLNRIESKMDRIESKMDKMFEILLEMSKK